MQTYIIFIAFLLLQKEMIAHERSLAYTRYVARMTSFCGQIAKMWRNLAVSHYHSKRCRDPLGAFETDGVGCGCQGWIWMNVLSECGIGNGGFICWNRNGRTCKSWWRWIWIWIWMWGWRRRYTYGESYYYIKLIMMYYIHTHIGIETYSHKRSICQSLDTERKCVIKWLQPWI